MDVEFADPTYTVKELKAKIARIGLKLPAKGSGKDGRLVKKDYEKILKMYKNKAVLELIKESTTYTVNELKAKIAEMGFMWRIWKICFKTQDPSTSRFTLLGTTKIQNRNDRLDFFWSGDLAIWR